MSEKRHVHVTMDTKLHKAAKVFATMNNKSFAKVVTEALTEYLARRSN